MALKERESEASDAKPPKGKEKDELIVDGEKVDKNKGLTDKEVCL